QEERDHVGLEGEHRGSQYNEKKKVLPGEGVLAKDEPSEERGRDDNDRRTGRYDNTIYEIAAEGRGLKRRGIVCQRPMDWEQPGGPQQRFSGGLEGSCQHPNEWKEHYETAGKKNT